MILYILASIVIGFIFGCLLQDVNIYRGFTSTNWLGGFISGVLATLIGFIFTMIWDTYKYRRDDLQKDRAIVSSVKEEIIANQFICDGDKKSLDQEVIALRENKSLVAPIQIFQNSAWELIKINFPKSIREDDNLLSEIRNLTQLIDLTNEFIKSRESYRINNGAMDNYFTKMQKYDESILVGVNDLNNRLASLKVKFDTLIDRIR